VDQYRKLNETEKKVADAIIQQKDVFVAFHDAQNKLMIELHQSTQTTVKHEHEKTLQVVVSVSQKSIQGINYMRPENYF